MKLLVYSHFFAPSIGGVETIVLSLARGLAQLRSPAGSSEFDVTLVTQTPAGGFDDRSLAFPVVRRPSFAALARLIRKTDLLHIAGPSLAPMLLARLAGRPVVLEHHGYQAICPNGVLLHQPERSICPGHFQARHYGECLRCNSLESSTSRSLAQLLLMFSRHSLSRRAACNIAITPHVRVRHALPRSAVVFYGIDDPFVTGSFPTPLLDTDGKPCFAYVGRLVPEKGLPVFLRAAQTLLEEGYLFKVRMIGDGPERPKLQEMASQPPLDDCVRFTGSLTGAALEDALRDVRVVVMPSIWEETAGLAAIEQMMRARLVIASNVGGLGQIVGDAGLLCAPGDMDALAACMRRVLQDPSLIDSLGQSARERALRFFARERMVGDHARIYLQVLRGTTDENSAADGLDPRPGAGRDYGEDTVHS